MKPFCRVRVGLIIGAVPLFVFLLNSTAHAAEAPPLINVDFGAGPGPSQKTGFAAIGQTTNDFWNFYTRDDATSHEWRALGSLQSLSYVDGAVSTAGLTIANAPGAWGNGSTDPMYVDFLYPFNSGNVVVTVTNLPMGEYDFYIYSSDSKIQLIAGGIDYGAQVAHDMPVSNPAVWQRGKQYVLFSHVIVRAGQDVALTVEPGVYGLAVISGLQIQLQALRPVILVQPQDTAASVGQNVVFSVQAMGTEPLRYQWLFNGTNLIGATNATLMLTNVQSAAAGTYSVTIWNSAGSINSRSAQLTVTGPPLGGFIINMDFGASTGPSRKVGPAATGQTSNDFWNFYTRDGAGGEWRTFGALTALRTAQGMSTPVGLTVANAPGAWGNGSTDPMYADYIYPFDGGNVTVALTNLPSGAYDVYLYANDGNYDLSTGTFSYGTKSTYEPAVISPPVWTEGKQYAVFRGVYVTDATITVTVKPGQSGWAVISGMQIVRRLTPIPPPPSLPRPLMNVDFGASNRGKVGPAALGQSPMDFWNVYSRDDEFGNWKTFGALQNLKYADQTPSSAGLTIANAPGAWGNGSTDPMYVDYVYPFDGGNVTITLTNLPTSYYDVYVYGRDGKYQITSGTIYGVRTTWESPVVNPPVWQEGVQYALFRSVLVTNGTMVLAVMPGREGYAMISGIQLLSSRIKVPPPPVPGIPTPMLSLQRASNGSWLRFTNTIAVPGVVICTSTNMIHWTPIYTNLAGAGLVEYALPARAQEPKRFYKAIPFE